ncbi:MAG: hypothetical protein ACTSSH_13185, partial [Candidatus Heimdallarchaeota archaeon]
IPKGPISKKEAEDIWPRYEMIGGMCRFFASNRYEATEVHERVISWGKFIDIKTSGISIEDITLMWLKKHEDELEENLQEERLKAKALTETKKNAKKKRRKQ